MNKLLIAVLATLALHALPAAAQFRPALQILIEKPGSARGDCGMGAAPLHTVATLALENSGARVVEDSSVLLYILPTVIQEGRTCFVNLDVSVRVRQPMAGYGGFKPRDGWGAILLCSAGVAGVADQDEISQDFLNQLAQQIKTCLERLEF